MKEISLSALLLKLFHYISKKRKQQFLLLGVLTLIGSAAEVISLGMVIPFVSILTQPENIFEIPFVPEILQILGVSKTDNLTLLLTIIFVVAALVAGVVRLLLLWFSIRLTNATGSDLSIEVYNRVLYQPYSIHIADNSSEIISSITQKVGNATSILMSLVVVITSLILFASILTALIFVDPMVATSAIICFGSLYGLIVLRARHRLIKNGKLIALEQNYVVKALQEGLGAIRDILLDSTQSIYSKIYKRSIQKLVRARGGNQYINQAPRYAMETLGILLIAVLAYVLSTRSNGIGAALPVLAALAIGAQRLLPLMQLLYGNWAVLAGGAAALSDIIDLLERPLPSYINDPVPSPLTFHKSISFDHVSFRYSDKSPLVLDDISLTITKGSKIGFIGTTGCGKSTLLDILMSLLEPTKGAVKVDGCTINSKIQRAWMRNIAHVPQNIFLVDSTITENIAFGVPLNYIDMDRVRLAATKAQISQFIESSLNGYDTIVGERGVRLSGGQRQRIGIARALYKQAELIILDEATSALDDNTEQSVMESISKLNNDITVFIVAHRLTTLKDCTKIVEITNGKIKNIGMYEDLVA